MDYQKYLYDKKKNEKKSDKVETKELRFTPNTGDHDFDFKVKHAQNFLEKGNRIKAFVFFKGREMAYKDKGTEVLYKLAVALEEYGTVESPAKMDGKKMIMFMRPKKK
jgi:translation initiation factor IF-3